MVMQQTHRTAACTFVPIRNPAPKHQYTTRISANTPPFTTATACRRADTGVGATDAAGSQL